MIRVLIADNNVELCATLESVLNTQPDIVVVGVALDGRAALLQIAEHSPDVVILDITMPHLDGLAVLEQMGSLGLAIEPQIIVLTALGREDIAQRFSELGAHYFMVKPVNLEVLAARVRQFARPETSAVVRPPLGYVSAPAVTDDERKAMQLLHELGVPSHFRGHCYLRDAIALLCQDGRGGAGTPVRHLYPQLAERYETTPGAVEAAIRHALAATWECGNRQLLARLTGSGGVQRKSLPPNALVLTRLAARVHADGAGDLSPDTSTG